MLPRNHLDRIQIAFDDHRLVNNAGLLLPATLALHLGLSQLVDRHLDLVKSSFPDLMFLVIYRASSSKTFEVSAAAFAGVWIAPGRVRLPAAGWQLCGV